MEISRDKKNPTWAWVGDTVEECESKKRIIIDIFNKGCYCVSSFFEKEYQEDRFYNIEKWNFYKIIKEPPYRPFKSIEEFKKFIKTRIDMRVERKQSKNIYTIQSIQSINLPTGMIFISEYGSIVLDDLFNYFTWIDGSPIGIKEDSDET